MPCLVVLLALLFPRVVILVLALSSTYLQRAYETAIWPVVGFFFMPLTTLAYALTINEAGSVRGVYAFLMVGAAMIDLGLLTGGEASRRRRRRRR